MGGVYVPPMQDKSVLTTLMKGLQIARDVYGIKADMSNLERAEAEAEDIKREKQRMAEGRLNKGEVQSLALKGYTQVPKGTARGVDLATDQGEITVRPPGDKSPLKEVITVSGGKPVTRFIAPKEGDEYERPKDDKSASPGEYKTRQDTLATTTDLRKEYNADPTTKRTLGVIDAYKSIKSAATVEQPTGASDMRLIFSFMKAMDPGSTVREGEYASAQNTGGVDERVRELYNAVLSGTRLSPEQRGNFAKEADSLLADQLENQKDTDSRYRSLAQRYGIDAAGIIDERFGRQPSNGRTQTTAVSASPKAAGTAKAAKAGDIVEVGGSRYRVAADGNTLEPIAGTVGN